MSRMGAGDESSPAKPSKAISSAQEAPPPTTPSYSDWSNSMQAYYGPGATPPPFFASTVASPSPYPYMWGGQHPLMPPYGTPVPYPAMYQPGGVYAHPNMPMTPNTGHANIEVEGKASNGKDRTSMKKAKGTSGTGVLIGAKAGESGKAGSGSGNDGGSQSDESGSEGSSDGSDENQQGLAAGGKKKSFNQMLADGANAQNSTGKAVVSMPATNLNIGMDLWNASASGARPVQDERELKRQKRKQSNRESARRSRLRKQAECEELQVRVETLNNENLSLRDELQRLSEECVKLTSENNSIKEELSRICGPDGKSNLEAIKKSRGEGNV